MKVKNVMSTEIETIEPEMSVRKAAEIMIRYRIGGLVVEQDQEIVGVITERDILKAFVKDMKPETFVKDVMTKEVITIEEDATLEDVAKRMLDYDIKRLPVVSKGRCVGIVTATDLITYEERLIDKVSELFKLPKKRNEAG